jgi:hypothetical protein
LHDCLLADWLAGDSNRPRRRWIVTKNLRTLTALGLGHTVGYGWDEMKSVTGADAEALATTIDFARARKQIEALELPPTVKARALWVFMGLSEMAAADGSVGLLATDFIPRLELNRASWTTYREVLTNAGLITSERNGRTRPVRILVPTSVG